jgi:hypothetical protein
VLNSLQDESIEILAPDSHCVAKLHVLQFSIAEPVVNSRWGELTVFGDLPDGQELGITL